MAIIATNGAAQSIFPRSSIRTPIMTESTLRTNLLIIPTVKDAIEAFQNADKAAWNHLFASKAELYDDGTPSNLRCFTQEALGCQRFLSIDRVANNGLYVEGEFYSEKRGPHRAYFNFELNSVGRIRRLDIGTVDDAE